MARWTALLVLVLAQDPGEPAVEFYRAVERHADAAREPEVKRRLERVRESLRAAACQAVRVDPVGAEEFCRRTHSVKKLLEPIQDRPVEGFWRDSFSDLPDPIFVLDEPLEPGVGAEQLVDLLKERVAPGTWEGAQTLEKTPENELVVEAPGAVQRQVTKFLKTLETQTVRRVSASVWVFALSSAEALPAGPDGGVDREAWDRLQQEFPKGGAALLLRRVDAEGRATQLISENFGLEEVRGSPPGGAVMQCRMVESGSGLWVEVRAGFRKVIGVDEFATPKGVVRIPRVVEVEAAEDRFVPEGKPVVLYRAGPLPEEAKLPPYIVFVGRFETRR